MRNLGIGLAVLAVVGGGLYYYTRPKSGYGGKPGDGGGGGGGAPPPPPAKTGYDVGKWHVAAVQSDYGRATLPAGTVAPGAFNPGDYVLFVLAYGGANDATKDPAGVALGQIGALGTPTASGKKVASVRFIQIINWNSNYSQSVPPPPPGTFYSVTTDDVAKVLTPAEVETALGTA